MKTREELIDEMAKAIYATGVALDGTDYAFGVYDDDDHFHRMASALIAAGIGDVTEWKERAEKHRVIALPGGRIKQLYSDEEVEQIVKERDSKEEAYNKCYFDYRYWKDKAKEYKHRAEVAEKDLERHKRALSCACYDKARTYSPNDDWREVAKKFEHDYLQQSEKELVEEKKDD